MVFGKKNTTPKLDDNIVRSMAVWEREKDLVKATPHGKLDAFAALESELSAVVARMQAVGGSPYDLLKQGNDIIQRMRDLQKRPIPNGRPNRPDEIWI
jgi:hypothetical protein